MEKKNENLFFQEQKGFPELETLCLACGSLAGVPRSDRFLYRYVNRQNDISRTLTASVNFFMR